jgi:DNA-binding transcriptional regulator WhiA
MKTKADIFTNALNLSAVELDEVVKIKEHISKIVAKDFKINHVCVGFAQLEVSIYTNYTDLTYKIEQDSTTYIHTCLGLIQVSNEVGEILINEVRERRQNNKYIDLRLIL